MPGDKDPNQYAPQGPWSINSQGNLRELIDFLGAQIGITFNHHEIHDGNFYGISFTFLLVADDAFADLRFLLGANSFHYGIRVTPEGKALALVYRNSTYTDNGTEVEAINNNCASSKTALLTAYHTPTIDTTGTLLTAENGILIPGGLGPQSIGADVKTDEERVGAATQDILVRVQNKSGLPKDITIQISGYEVVPD
jgi:hypothetical protein